MNISIDLQDGVPIYRQIANQIRYLVASGQLMPGDEIAAVRSLALKLNVTPNTVVKAYKELETAGVIYKRRGAGTYVAENKNTLASRERSRIIENRIDALLSEAHQLGIKEEELLELITTRLEKMNRS
jgi:GntR family transcriptional regulator